MKKNGIRKNGNFWKMKKKKKKKSKKNWTFLKIF